MRRALPIGPGILTEFVLSRCPECSAEVSKKAVACPKCGHPFTAASSPASGVFGGLVSFFIGLPIILLGGFIVLAFIAKGCDDSAKADREAVERAANEQIAGMRMRQEQQQLAIFNSPEQRERRDAIAKQQAQQAKVEAEQREQEQLRLAEERVRPARDRLAKTIAYQQQQASNGYPSFQIELGKRYMRGDGVETNLALARHWLQSACTNGESQASNLLMRLTNN